MSDVRKLLPNLANLVACEKKKYHLYFLKVFWIQRHRLSLNPLYEPCTNCGLWGLYFNQLLRCLNSKEEKGNIFSSEKYFTIKTTSPKQWFPAQILLNAMLSKNDPKRWKIIKLYSFYSHSYFPLSIFLLYNTLEEKILKRCYSCSQGPEVASLASHLPSSLVTEILFSLEQSLV